MGATIAKLSGADPAGMAATVRADVWPAAPDVVSVERGRPILDEVAAAAN
jgi:hypothetical protein